jgi:hypothetical protein
MGHGVFRRYKAKRNLRHFLLLAVDTLAPFDSLDSRATYSAINAYLDGRGFDLMVDDVAIELHALQRAGLVISMMPDTQTLWKLTPKGVQALK